MKNHRKQSWQKTLYGNEGYPDNYTDPKFLKDLQKNINVQIFEYPEAVLGATKLTHQISLIVVFVLIFVNLHADTPLVLPQYLFIGCAISSAIGYLIYALLKFNRSECFPSMRDDLSTVVSVLLFGYILSPMFHTLTKSISTDTIYTVTFLVFLLHLMCFDYGMPAILVSNAISLNAVVFGALCLASRLRSSFDAFVLLVVTVQLFVLYPQILSALENYPRIWSRIVPATLIATFNCICLMKLSTSLFVTNIIMMVFIGFIYPFIFCHAQKYKNNIHGPWDEAVVDVNVNNI